MLPLCCIRPLKITILFLLSGRLVVFFSQEIEHEVLPSEGERFAITQWVWDAKRDERGR